MLNRRRLLIVSLVGVVSVLVGASLRTRASTAPLTRDHLASTFDVGIRHLVFEWDPKDPRPEAERRRSLFDFMYETYDASAWIPQALFDRTLVAQASVGDLDTIVGDKVGLVLWHDN